jgi:hypothetical protein
MVPETAPMKSCLDWDSLGLICVSSSDELATQLIRVPGSGVLIVCGGARGADSRWSAMMALCRTGGESTRGS